MSNNNAICGNCGNKRSDHFNEARNGKEFYFCNEITNGDTFTDNPSKDVIYEYLVETQPEMIRLSIIGWKKKNGHL